MSATYDIPLVFGDDTARARRTDPQTSHAAADSNTTRAAVEAFVLHLFNTHGFLTDAELTSRYFSDPSHPPAHQDSPRKRRSDLTNASVIVETTRVGRSPSGRAMSKYALRQVAELAGVVKPVAA